MRNPKGFLVLEMLVAGVILTASIAAAMYLFRIGAENLARVNNSNVISAKLPQAVSLIRGLDLQKPSGTEELGDGVILRWESRLIDQLIPGQADFTSSGQIASAANELYLFRVEFSLEYVDRLKREYSIHVFRHKSLRSPTDPF